MTPDPHTPALRTPRLGLLLAAALLVMAAPANAVPGLPVDLPSASQRIDTPAGRIDASAGGQGASVCSDLSTPALPSLPAAPGLPVPVPVAVPAVPAPSAGAALCASSGLDGASAQVGIDAAGSHALTGIEAKPPVSPEEVHSMAGETAGNAKGFFESVVDALFGWI